MLSLGWGGVLCAEAGASSYSASGYLRVDYGYDGESPGLWDGGPEGRRQGRARTWLKLVWECIS